MRNSDLLTMCLGATGPAGTTLQRPQFGMTRIDDPDGTIYFHLPHGQMIRLLRESGFVVEDLIEIQAPEGAVSDFDYVELDWARKWPSEEVWRARRV